MFELEVTSSFTGDVEIGAVEGKDATTDNRWDINAANTARTTATKVLATQAVDAAGNVLDTTSLALESGGNLATIAGDTTSLDGKVTACNTGAVVVASGAITETNSGTIAGDTTSIDGKITACDTDDVSLGTLISGEDETNDVMKVEQRFTSVLVAAAGADNVISASPNYLKGIILGGIPAADAIIEVSDHASDGDGNVVIYAAGGDGTDSLLEQTLVDKHKGYIPVEREFTTGITADITNQTNVIFVIRG